MRTFFGIPVKDDLLNSARHLVKEQKKNVAMKKIRWAPNPNWHLTLCFLGNTTDEQLNKLCELTKLLAKKISSFDIESNGLLFLPQNTPKIFSISVRLNEPLAELVHDLKQITEQCGFEPDSRVFLPHITLGRWKPALHHPPDVQLKNFASQTVSEFHLYKSEPGDKGSMYTPIQEFPLKKYSGDS